jgi:ABC-type Co2+ transport system permease subunit
MGGFLSAHGYEPGPTQRPLLAGSISGVLATAPAILILKLFGSLRVEAEILGRSELLTVAVGCLVMGIAGALYGRLFGRAANDVRGGWLFGMTFGFALWAAGGALVLPLASGGRAPAGEPAMGLFLSLVVWGAALGLIHPFVHRPLHQSIETGSRRSEVGPSAAASNQQRGPRRDLRPAREAPPDGSRS